MMKTESMFGILCYVAENVDKEDPAVLRALLKTVHKEIHLMKQSPIQSRIYRMYLVVESRVK